MRKARLVIPLEAIQDTDADAVGAKALSLARMNRIGFSVPAGFCVTGAAYREHISCGRIMPKLKAAMTGLTKAEPDSKREILAELGIFTTTRIFWRDCKGKT